MIILKDNDIIRNDVKIGWISGNYIYNHTGNKVGYTTSDNYVYDEITGKKLAHIDGDYIYDPNTGSKTRLEDSIMGIDSPALSDIQRVAIKIFFGN